MREITALQNEDYSNIIEDQRTDKVTIKSTEKNS